MQETHIQSLEKEMATDSSILAWEIPWAEEPGWLQFMGSQRAGHNLVTKWQQPGELGASFLAKVSLNPELKQGDKSGLAYKIPAGFIGLRVPLRAGK